MPSPAYLSLVAVTRSFVLLAPAQIVFAAVAPGNVVASLVAGAVAEAGAQQAGDMMQDFKTASLLGEAPNQTGMYAYTV
jgi:uncharacterized oligopeptide transporter (OPT) family protein